MIEDVSSSSFAELETLGLRTACRILWAQNQLLTLEKPDSGIYCGHCIRNGYGTYQLPESGTVGKSKYSNCPNCGYNPEGSGYGAYGYIDTSKGKLTVSLTAARDKAEEVFKDDIEEAERQDALPETLPTAGTLRKSSCKSTRIWPLNPHTVNCS